MIKKKAKGYEVQAQSGKSMGTYKTKPAAPKGR